MVSGIEPRPPTCAQLFESPVLCFILGIILFLSHTQWYSGLILSSYAEIISGNIQETAGGLNAGWLHAKQAPTLCTMASSP